MDKRYQVFVSSTFEDLQDERREVMQALLTLSCIPTGMELFPAADELSTQVIKRFIAECDYYIVIVAGRYGSTLPDGKSYTELEYDYALEAKLPILAFLHQDPGTIPSKKTEQTNEGRAALDEFRKRITDARHAKFWTSPKDLALAVYQGVSTLTASKPGIGWVRGDCLPDESAAQEILRLRRRIDELEAHITHSEVAPPPGTEGLAQGDEKIPVHFRYEQPNGRYADQQMAFSWNEILSIFGPHLLIHATESDLKNALSHAFANRLEDKVGGKIAHEYVRDQDFQQVKLQLRALGLIHELKEKSYNAGDLAVWSLTPYGDHVLTQVAAIRSSAEA